MRTYRLHITSMLAYIGAVWHVCTQACWIICKWSPHTTLYLEAPVNPKQRLRLRCWILVIAWWGHLQSCICLSCSLLLSCLASAAQHPPCLVC